MYEPSSISIASTNKQRPDTPMTGIFHNKVQVCSVPTILKITNKAPKPTATQAASYDHTVLL